MATPERRKGLRMNAFGLLLPAAILLALVLTAATRDGLDGLRGGLGQTGHLLLRVLPNLAIGFTLAGFLTYLLPEALVARWLGAGTGLRGLLAGSVAGALTPGGPFTHFPILASLLARGAAIGPVSAYIAAWALFGIHRILIWEAPILGWRFVAIRAASCLVFPPLIGALAAGLATLVRFEPNGPLPGP
jgi:uncharacterized membrane protein YraQ (UPF0718 family)